MALATLVERSFLLRYVVGVNGTIANPVNNVVIGPLHSSSPISRLIFVACDRRTLAPQILPFGEYVQTHDRKVLAWSHSEIGSG
jgi:hypothetical protein